MRALPTSGSVSRPKRGYEPMIAMNHRKPNDMESPSFNPLS